MLTYAIMLDIVSYVQFVIMLTELKKVLSVYILINANNMKQGVFVKHNYHSPIRMNHNK